MASNSFKVKNSLVLTPKDLSTLTSPEAGDLACDINDSNKIKRYDANATAWVEVGSGGVGGVDIFFVQDFESASLSSFTQTGLVLSQTNPLKGNVSAGLTHQAGTSPTNDQFFTQIIPVDRKFRGQLMSFALNVRSTASPGNLVLKVRDVTNSSDIIVSEQIQTSSNPFTANTSSGSPTLSNISNADMALLQIGEAVSGSGIPTGAVITALGTNQVTISANASATATGVSLRASSLPARRTFSFKIPESCASLSYTITALPEANSPRSIIDDIICELSESALLETSVVTPNVTAWQGYTPTFQGFGSPSAIEFEWRQVGENVEIRGKFTSGTTTAVEARVGLPAGLTSAGTSLIPSLQIIGAGNASAAAGRSASVLIEPSVTYMTFGFVEGGSGNWLTKANGNAISASSGSQSFFASVPCAGLSATSTKTIPLTQSGLVQNPDSSIRLDTANGYGSTNTRIARFTNLRESRGSDILYQDSATLGASFTVQTSGVYSMSYSASFAGAAHLGISRNSSQLTTDIQSITVADRLIVECTDTVDRPSSVSWTGFLNQGDVIRPHNQGTAFSTAANASFTITKESSLKQVSVSSNQKITIPTSELRMEGASTRGSTDTAIVRFDNIAKIRGDAFTVESDSVLGTRITMKKAGKLDVNTTIFRSGSTNNIYISKNQLILTGLPSQSETMSGTFHSGTNDQECVSWSGFVSINDVIRISTSQTPTADIRSNLNLAFQEQDISVSVTNTLPQFSESDSSVRVDTANGYGSTATKIRRFSNVRDNIGTDITYNPNSDEATNGASFRVNSAGIYAISFSDAYSSSGQFLGISKNASSLTTDIQTLATSERLASTDTSAINQTNSCSWQGYLVAGDVIRAHTQGSVSGANPDRTTFTISKVGKPNVTGVNVTPFVNVPQSDVESIAYLGTGAQLLDVTAEVRFPTSISTTNKGIIAVQDDSGNTRTKFTALKRCTVNVSWSASISGAGNYANVYKNGSILQRSTALYISTGIAQVSWTGVLNVGDFLSFGSSSNVVSDATPAPVYITAEAQSDQILTAPETFSTDTASLQYAGSGVYTISTLQNAPVGTYITFTYAANTNTRTQTTVRPTQTDADMNANGILMRVRAGDGVGGGASQPAAVAIQIGKGHKGYSTSLFKSAGKVTPGTMEYVARSSLSESGFSIVSYNEVTGILYLDCGFYQTTSISNNKFFVYSDLDVAQVLGYVVINASKNVSLTGMNIERVSARAVNSAGTSYDNTGSVLVYDAVKTFDTHGALNAATGVFTAPETGFYQVNARVLFAVAAYTVNQTAQLYGYKNGTVLTALGLTYAQAASSFQMAVNGSDVVFLNKGDTFDVRVFNTRGSTALLTSTGVNFLSIAKTNIGGKS